MQWNCQGLGNKKEELISIIERERPRVIALQETMLRPNHPFRIPHYTFLNREGHYNRKPHGGVALLIHESIPIQIIYSC